MQDYFKGEQIKEANAETFENMSDKYSKDWKNVYYGKEIIKNADIENFIIIGYGYAKDWKYFYYNGEIIKILMLILFKLFKKNYYFLFKLNIIGIK